MYRTTLLSDTTKSNLCAKIAKAERRDKRRTKFFRFGCSEPHSIYSKNAAGDDDEGDGEGDAEISGTDIPAAGTLWDGHLVVLSTPDDHGGATLLC